ncbi:type I-E CRISPR-associated protein Cas5/CasD [Chitiniphilus eburneus]|uniref:Type I-E CRISPR-associated protein Cas5/CasD n=1 Tax=Chitiniphilus eburneus TaxID=2571148 RepID=A0A4U0PR26_9NEIS|nr:type I-E CRISPR-associated protein Cas5/CasD [Chitiniphilus eburneus]TJZ70707.1 type I-E CRISPR-associated protein Cas5/CasD [Chitiniphilus eburneus]
MTDYLVFRLYGPLASWGEIAVGESRHSAVQPSKSALLGLIGAALGIRRDDEAGQAALASGYRFGVKLIGVGTPLRDFHTVQIPAAQRKVVYRTRRQEVSNRDRLGTLLSAREYRCDSLAVIAAEALPAAPATLEQVAQALRQPHFTLYLGRKSCPLAEPLRPQQVQAETLRQALDHTEQPSLLALLTKFPQQAWPTAADQRHLGADGPARYYWEQGMLAGMEPGMRLARRDQPLSRTRWQFAPRSEAVWLDGGSAA